MRGRMPVGDLHTQAVMRTMVISVTANGGGDNNCGWCLQPTSWSDLFSPRQGTDKRRGLILTRRDSVEELIRCTWFGSDEWPCRNGVLRRGDVRRRSCSLDISNADASLAPRCFVEWVAVDSWPVDGCLSPEVGLSRMLLHHAGASHNKRHY